MSAQNIPAWRGIAEDEDEEQRSAGVGSLLRRQSRELLASLLRPYRPGLTLASFLILVQTGAMLAVPYLIGVAIDRGIRPLAHGSPNRTVLVLTVVFTGDVGGKIAPCG